MKIFTDHKPLQAIVKKPLCLAPKRLQSMILKTQQYDTDIEYQPGEKMFIADFLSRAYLEDVTSSDSYDYISQIAHLPICEERLRKIQNASKSDSTLQRITDIITQGWAEDRKDLPPEAIPYFHFRDELSVQDGLIFKGTRIVIPAEMRKEIREALHIPHCGIEGSLCRACECVYWPGMNSDLKEYFQKCEVCNSHGQKQQKETLMSHEATDRSFEKIGVDLFELNKCNYLVTVECFSNFWEVDPLTLTTTAAIVRKLKGHFACYGIPVVLVSDNGPQFSSQELKKIVTEWDVEHRTSSPGHQQANGKSEAAVKTAKHIIGRAITSKQDPTWLSLNIATYHLKIL